MKKKDSLIRKSLFNILPFETYLLVLSKIYLYSYKTGILRNNPFFEYQYFLQKVIKKGDTCIDIGANLGYYSVPMAKLAGKEGKVYAIEPVKPVLKVLRTNTKKFNNIEILPYALGQENKTIQLGNDTMKSKGYIASGSHFILDNKSKAKDEVDIEFDAEMKKASELFADLSSIDFIKCDVEGYEIYIIPEMEPLILKHRPILFIETNGEARKKIMDLFHDNNFQTFVLKDGMMHEDKGDKTGDLIVIPDEKVADFNQYIH
ncbi:MAG: FkbM family methyltransferase, partial [Bacteroidales bacterium]